jgi:hypothetical protein
MTQAKGATALVTGASTELASGGLENHFKTAAGFRTSVPYAHSRYTQPCGGVAEWFAPSERSERHAAGPPAANAAVLKISSAAADSA